MSLTLPNVIMRGLFSARPAAGESGALYFASDTSKQYRDNGSSWDEVDIFGVVQNANKVLAGPTTGSDAAPTFRALANADLSGITSVIGMVIDGGGSAITTGVKHYLSIPFACTITGWDIVADQSGSISVEIDKHAAAVPNTSTDKISASAPVSLSSAQLAQGGSISGWTTAIAANDVLGYNVASAATLTRVTIGLRVTRA